MRISSFVMGTLAIAIIGLAACGDEDTARPDAPMPDAPAVELTCANYCTRITANCTGTNQQLPSMTECMSTCMHYPMGTAADMTGNTLGCRLYHAGAANEDPALHCRHAGPGGDNACGDNCLGFCTLVLGACTGANMQYNGDMGQCMTACGNYATAPPYDTSVRTGDTFACRLYHATVASTDPGTHCRHTAANSQTCQ